MNSLRKTVIFCCRRPFVACDTVALALEQFDLIRKNRLLQQDNSKKTKEISALSKLSVSKSKPA